MLERARGIVGPPFTSTLEGEKEYSIIETALWRACNAWILSIISAEAKNRDGNFFRKDLWRNRLSNEVTYTEDHENSLPAETLPAWNEGKETGWYKRSSLAKKQLSDSVVPAVGIWLQEYYLTSVSIIAAAAKSLQLCRTLCDPIDGSPPGSPVPGILQARTLEWVAISFSNAWKWKVKVKLLSRVRLFATPWTAAYQAPPTMGFSRQEYCSGVPSPSLVSISICKMV